MSLSAETALTPAAFVQHAATMPCFDSSCSGSGRFLGSNGTFVLRYVCKTCQEKWWCCSLCFDGAARQFATYSMDYRFSKHAASGDHRKLTGAVKFFLGKASMVPDNARGSVSKEPTMPSKHIKQTVDTHPPQPRNSVLARKHFSNGGRMDDFFSYELLHNRSGVTQIISKGVFRHCFDHSTDSLSPNEVLEEFRLASLFDQLPLKLACEASALIGALYERGRKHERDSTMSTPLLDRHIPPVYSHSEVRRRYLESSFSFKSGLPIPAVVRTQDHAYSDISECLKIALAHGIPIVCIPVQAADEPQKQCFSDILDSPRGKQMARSAMISGLPQGGFVVPALQWRDDIDPNWTKGTRGSDWLQTVTFPGTDSSWNSRLCTFPITVGKSKADHSGVEHSVYVQMRHAMKLPTSVYSKAFGDEIVVSTQVFAEICDQPEKRKATKTATGHQRYHARFGYSADHSRLIGVLRPCKDCVAAMRDGSLRKGCTDCVNWDVEKEGPVRDILKLPPRYFYPVNGLENDNGISYLTADGNILPHRVTFERLKASFDLAFRNFSQKKWSRTQTVEFLATECFNSDLIDTIVEHGMNAQIISEILAGISKADAETQSLYRAAYELERGDYVKPDYPAAWKSGDPLSLFVDSPMHLLFLGLVRTSLRLVKAWLAKQGLLTDFLEKAKVLNSILDDLKLDWLPLMEFREGKFGGWISENYVAFARVTRWFFQDVSVLIRGDHLGDDSIPPSARPNTTWKKKHFLRWFQDRGLKPEGLTKEAMKVSICKLLDRDGGPPPLVDADLPTPPEQLERMLLALDSMLAAVMCDEVVLGHTCELAELKIKHFLTEFDLLHSEICDKGTKSKVISSFNCLCALNIPAMMGTFGPLSNVWEGNMHGEAFVRCIKKHLRYGQRENFATNALIHCHEDAAFALALENFSRDNDPSFGEGNNQSEHDHWKQFFRGNMKSFRVYADRAMVVRCLASRMSLSTVVLLGPKKASEERQQSVFVVVATPGDRSDFTLYRLHRTGSAQKTKLGLPYSMWIVEQAPRDFGEIFVEFPPPHFAGSFGCLLPCMSDCPVASHTHICRDRMTRVPDISPGVV